ncbi:MAG: M3 family oligoendopeptidase [Clostridia bacterium]|nr:M3 family oligoendopeptidase [Clostridia bacterium]
MIDFASMPYARPDMDRVRTLYLETTKALQTAKDYADARAAFFRLQEEESHLMTAMSICEVRNTIDTTDAFYSDEVQWFIEQSAALIPLRKAYQEALAISPFRPEFEQEFGSQLFRLIDADLKANDASIIEETIREGEISQQYQKDSAAAVTTFRGEKCNFYGLLRHMESKDREERKEAFIAWANLYASISPKLEDQYDNLVKLRTEKARKLGFDSYTDLAYISRNRFDYTQEDVAVFRRQIRDIITPAVAEIRARQQEKLGLSSLCYYDEALLFPEGNADPIGTTEELVRKAQDMYREMSPETGEFFDFMVRYHLFDLESRPGKRMGGYMTAFPDYKAPFIFSNFNGTSADVDVLTHEAGHAFQGYLAMRSIPIELLSGSTSEINEIHSMTMEHFAYPWMDRFFGENSWKYRTAHLIGAISVIPYMACVDEFQHRIYENPDLSASDRRHVWREIEKTYMPWRSYDGHPFLEDGGFWMQKQHIFLYPFYYIDYALAQVCAFQYYSRMTEDRAAAWQDYLRLCRAGGTMGYFDLLKTGNLMNPFHEGTVEKSIAAVLTEIRDNY